MRKLPFFRIRRAKVKVIGPKGSFHHSNRFGGVNAGQKTRQPMRIWRGPIDGRKGRQICGQPH